MALTSLDKVLANVVPRGVPKRSVVKPEHQMQLRFAVVEVDEPVCVWSLDTWVF